MSTLETESIAHGIARGRQLPAELVGELPGRAGLRAGRGTRDVPRTARRYGFREGQRDRPGTKRRGAGVGDAHIHLEEAAACIGRRRGTAVCGKCLPVQ
jgi:hypothetical protein